MKRKQGKCPWCKGEDFKVVAYGSPLSFWHVYCATDGCNTIIIDVKVGGCNTTQTFDGANVISDPEPLPVTCNYCEYAGAKTPDALYRHVSATHPERLT